MVMLRGSVARVICSGLIVLTLLVGLPIFSQIDKTRVPEKPSLRISVDLVVLDVSVQDKNGQPVHGLNEKDFRVYEDKVEQPVSSFSAEESPVTWGLVLDRSSSMRDMTKEVYAAALNVIDQGTNEDEMFIMTFNNKTEIVSDLTSDRRQLANSIFGLHADGSTALYDAVDSALDHVKQGKHRKKVLVVVTDGGDNKSRIRFSRLVEKVKESDVLIYTVGMYGGMAHNPTESRLTAEPQNRLRQLAEITGAYAHFPQDSNKCREVMAKIAQEVSEHYTIGYYPTKQMRDGRWRKIKVVVDRQPNAKYIVRSRAGYYAPGTEDGGRDLANDR